ncbi:MAG: hypothetical protein LBQ26_02135 [Holosporales bacterium]|nr:hypothetical protein [Holosporales bacterium]
MSTPVGKVLCVYEESMIIALSLIDEIGCEQAVRKLRRSVGPLTLKEDAPFSFDTTVDALRSFLKAFLHQAFLVRGTPFQVQVWKTLMTVCFGERCSYSTLAERAGFPRSPEPLHLR